MQLTITATWLDSGSLHAGHARELLRLLRTLREHRSLRDAARSAELSYRFAWGLLTTASRDFGTPLVELTRGRGAELTQTGRQLLALDDKVAARLNPVFEKLSTDLQPELARLATKVKVPLLVHASHDLALSILRDLAAGKGIDMELHFQGSTACLDDLAKRRCDVAGFHMAESLGGGVGALRADRHRAVTFALREQGLMFPKGTRIESLGDLKRRNVRFINRQKGSGTRDLFDGLLRREGISPAAIRGYADEEFTHLAVAATVAAGHADAGFGIRAAAAQYGLEFVPVETERYCLAASNATFESAAFKAILGLMGSRAFRARAGALPGYDLSRSGSPAAFATPPGRKK